MLKAARLINFLFNRHVQYFKVMTDMPTEEAIHFSDSAKDLSKGDKAIYHLLSTNPFSKYDNESEENYIDRMDAWWKEHFNLSLKEGKVTYADFPLRPAFTRVKEEGPTGDIGIKLNNEDEKRILVEAKIINDSPIEKVGKALDQKTGMIADTKYDYAPMAIDETDMVGLITIGSMANANATKAYIEDVVDLVELFNEMSPEGEAITKNFHLFVACGRHEPGKNSLFSQVAEMIKSKKDEGNFPENLNIVPMGFQSDEEMAPLMHRADFGVYGAGGLTTMETLNASDSERAHVFVHSDAKVNPKGLSNQEIETELLKGYALWEKGNAEFQLRNDTYEADLVSPHEIFSMRLKELFEIPTTIDMPVVPEDLAI